VRETTENIQYIGIGSKKSEGKLKKLLELYEYENTKQNWFDTANLILRGKFIAVSAYINKSENSN
jgi:hypothetical protein